MGEPLRSARTLDPRYLIQTAQGYLLWETGAPDGLVARPAPGGTPLVLSRTQTLLSQLAELDVEPIRPPLRGDLSHTRGTMLGTWTYFQRSHCSSRRLNTRRAFAPDRNNPPFSPNRPVEQVEGDRDVFGGGSVTLISTPGHTSGHQSLLVNLEETGWVVLAGDATQVKEQWDRWSRRRRVTLKGSRRRCSGWPTWCPSTRPRCGSATIWFKPKSCGRRARLSEGGRHPGCTRQAAVVGLGTVDDDLGRSRVRTS